MSVAKVGLPLLAAVLIVGAGVTTLWLIGSASGERAKFSSLDIAPKEADAFFAINTDPTSPQWLAVNDSLGAVGAKDPIRDAIDEALAEVNLDWEEDILPVAGDEAFFSVPSFDEVDDTTGFVAGFQIANEDKAEEVFDSLRERAEDEGEELAEEEYEGVTIYLTESGAGFGPEAETGAVALFDEVLAIGGSADDVKSVIDVVQGRAPSAKENERLTEFREAQRGDFLMWGYADLASVWEMLESGLATEIDGEGGGFEPFPTPEPLRTPQPTVTPAPTVTPVPETDYRITSFDAEYTMLEGGMIDVTETIAVDFGSVEKHGFYRDFDTRVPYDFFNDEILEIMPGEATIDGVEEGFGMQFLPNDVTRVEIGDPNVPMTGEHVYTLRYTLVGGVNQWITGDDPYYEVILDATGVWGVPMSAASITFTVPNGVIIQTSCKVNVHLPGEDYFFGYDLCDAEQASDEMVTFVSTGGVPYDASFRVMLGVNGESGRLAQEVNLVPNEDFDFDFDGDQFDDEFDFEDEPLFPFDFDTEELFDQLKGTYDRVGFSVSSTSDGFAFDVTVLHADGFEPEFAFEPEQAFDSHFAETVSADTMFFFAGYDIYGQNWLPAKEWFEDVEFTDGKTLDDYLEDFSDETGLDLEEDILALLTGEYAVAGDVSDWDQDTPDFNILALLDVADANRAQDTLDELGNYLEDQGMVSVDASDPIQEWTFLEDSDIDAIGVTEDDGAVIIGYPVSAVEDAVDGHASSLADTEEWRRTVGLLPDDTTSIGFLSLARILDEASKVEDFEDGLEEATDGDITVEQLRALRSVGYATTSRENGFGVHFVLFVEER